MKDYMHLQCGEMSAEIDLLRGGQCVRLQHRGYGADLLRYDENADPASFLYGMPPLFPPNRISGGKFTFEGREYRFPINEPDTDCFLHGEMNHMHFEVEKIEGTNRLSCVYHATKEHPYLTFPHAFTLRMEYQLGADSLTQIVCVTNDSEENMPYALGFHTTFNVPFVRGGDREQVLAQVDLSEEYERNAKYLPTGRIIQNDPLTARLLAGDQPAVGQCFSRHYKRGESGVMSLTDPAKGVRMVYRPDPKYGYRLIYNGDASSFICMEPQSWMTDSPNSPFGRERSGFRFLRPGESEAFCSVIALETI